MTAHSTLTRPGRLVAALVVLGLVAACGREPAFEDRTAQVELGGRTTTFTLDSCGLDGRTVFLVGRSDGGAVLQAVVDLEADGKTGVPDSTGFTVDDPDDPDGPYGAFGPEAWQRRGEDGPPPGSIAAARLRGARVQVEGEAQHLDEDGSPIGSSPAVKVSLDSRCDE